MAKFLVVLVALIFAGISYMTVRYGKESYELLPMPDQPEKALESQIAAESDFQNWQEFSPVTGIFKVLMPSQPQHVADHSIDQEKKVARKDNLYVAEQKNGSVFMIHVVTYENKNEVLGDEMLQKFRDEMLASNPNNKLLASDSAPYKGLDTLDFAIENDDYRYDVREFSYDNTLVVLSRVSPKSLNNLKDYEFFINSFEFTPLEQQENKN